ncbi:uncharacterized protein LOC125522151 [Triticum urartu]|uniref:uncharacterized protein LOC125522151 n=1 Tax=Triticum urartu TaxID=4572 RepID=UPI0020433C99|nr:uncharacterized protein LOC125522151 [Triticum urartu]
MPATPAFPTTTCRRAALRPFDRTKRRTKWLPARQFQRVAAVPKVAGALRARVGLDRQTASGALLLLLAPTPLPLRPRLPLAARTCRCCLPVAPILLPSPSAVPMPHPPPHSARARHLSTARVLLLLAYRCLLPRCCCCILAYHTETDIAATQYDYGVEDPSLPE